MQHPDDDFDALISPDELSKSLSVCQSGRSCLIVILDIKAEAIDVMLELLIRDSSIKVLVHMTHNLVNLLFADCEAEAL